VRPAAHPLIASRGARLLVVDNGRVSHHARQAFPQLLRPGDLVVANDAAVLPASLHGTHAATGSAIEVRLAGRQSLDPQAMNRFVAVVFGAGDYRIPTEERPAPPALAPGDLLQLGPLAARVARSLGHARLIELDFAGSPGTIWANLARHGRPIQYAYVPAPLEVWDTWTRVAARPVAFEAPSAGFLLDWSMLRAIRGRGARFATITHAAGISSTGDAELDRRLPLPEPYEIPASTSALIEATRAAGGRVIAIGTTVVRALEAASDGEGHVRSGAGLATGRIGPESPLEVVDALVSGMHEPGTSHYELLKAFAGDAVLETMTTEAEAKGYLAHEYGDFMLLVRQPGYAMRTFRGNCELSSRNVFLRDSSADVGCVPLASLARDTIVCSPAVAPSHL
jgi:S-adenosylmethionine:tRNA ribosyltransferase-isomerase